VWIEKSTLGAQSLTDGAFIAGLATARNKPKEYGTHWDGFGKRYAMRLSGISTSGAIEAGAGALWGEDPRYERAIGKPVQARIGNVFLLTFAARTSDGDLAPAYARYIGKAGGNFLSNAWRADSASTTSAACVRTILGFVGRMSSNAFAEFWPDARQYLFHRRQPVEPVKSE
jgi:hypothetical protein